MNLLLELKQRLRKVTRSDNLVAFGFAIDHVDEAFKLGWEDARGTEIPTGQYGDWLAKATFAEAAELAPRPDAEVIIRNMRGMASLMADMLNRQAETPCTHCATSPPCCKFGPGGCYVTEWPRKAAE